ncbi:MAG: hypothetical protein U9Q74_17175 [Gemmatimonadota bacterium]|nr:hypothetical protein [Gemmatimonadota bacterium]
MPPVVGYIPIATTIVALVFATELFRRWRARGGPHHLWFAIGALTYAAGTITESATTLFGWHAGVFRAWYITGALLGGAPLAQGAVYLHLQRRTANILSVVLVTAIVVASACVIASPIHTELVEPFRLTGKVLAWGWVRAFSPFINTYAAAFLIGGAIKSAWFYSRSRETRDRMIGNILIAVGALLPGIGGTATRFGHTEVLYVTEFVGLLLIYAGYRYSVGTTRAPGLASTAA